VRDLSTLTADDFEPAVGTLFVTSADDPGEATIVDLRLVEVHRWKGTSGLRAAFTLRFLGPTDPVLSHDVHRIDHVDLGPMDIFLGPVVDPCAGVMYEAVFT
jgi:hypothetical protein